MIAHGPDRARPSMPDGYGLPNGTDGLLRWDQVEERLRSSLHYWLATVRPDGTPLLADSLDDDDGDTDVDDVICA
jgi:hypothetical protein